MTTTTSFSNKNLFWSAYKHAISKLKGIGILYAGLSVLAYPLMCFMIVNNINKLMDFDPSQISRYFFGYPAIYPGATIATYLPMVIIMALIMGVVVNGYMHNKKSVDAYHSLPIKKETMLLANFSAVMTIITIPMFICYLCVFGIDLFMPLFNVSSLDILLEFLKQFCLIFGLEALISFCAVCTCASFDTVIFTISLNVIVPSVMGLTMMFANEFLLGYQLDSDLLLKSIYTFPIGLMFTNTFISSNSSILPEQLTIINNFNIASYLWLIWGIILLTLACYIYKKRKSELAQSYDTSGILYKIIIIVGSFGASSSFAVITSMLMNNSPDSFTTVILSIIYGFFAYFIINGILARSLKANKKNMITLILSTILSPIFLTLMITGWFGYENFIPKAATIDSVSINYIGRFYNVNYYDEDTNKQYGDQYKQKNTFKEEENINLITQLQQNIITNKDLLYENYYSNIIINYNLKNGNTIKRNYNGIKISSNACNILAQLDEKKEFVTQNSPLILANSDKVKTISFSDAFYNTNNQLDLSKSQIDALYNAMATDTLSESLSDLTQTKGIPYGYIDIQYKNEYEYIDKYTHKPFKKPPFTNVKYMVHDYSVNTIKALKDMGMDKYLTKEIPANCQLMIFYDDYYRDDLASGLFYNFNNIEDKEVQFVMNNDDNPNKIITSNPNEITEYLKNAHTTIYKYEPYLNIVLLNNNNNNPVYSLYYLLYNDAPDDVKAKFAPYFDDNK